MVTSATAVTYAMETPIEEPDSYSVALIGVYPNFDLRCHGYRHTSRASPSLGRDLTKLSADGFLLFRFSCFCSP